MPDARFIDAAPAITAERTPWHARLALQFARRDACKMRGERPFVFTNLKTGRGLDDVVAFIPSRGMLRTVNMEGVA